jgi:signal peptidase I
MGARPSCSAARQSRGPRRAPRSRQRTSRGGCRAARARARKLGAFALLAYLCLFNFSVVRGSSMAPRIHDGDRILIDHWSYMLAPVQRGDIVVLKYPLDPSVDYIKRVIGLPGDRVVLEEGKVYVNGTELAEPYVQAPDALAHLSVEVLPAHYFVLGDNRRRSCDSREFGQVPCDYVRGKVEVRVWPPQRAGRIDA